jgi:hypothetical protein
MPAKATDTFTFVSGGDCGVNAHAVANNVQAARQDPAFAVVGGDLGYDNGRSVATSLAFLRNYSAHMVGRGGRLIPLVACLGNHEVDGGYGKGRDKAPFFYALFDGLYPDTGYAALDFGDYLSLVLLDTGHTSAIGGDQSDWLDTALRTRRDRPHVFVVGHVPAWSWGRLRAPQPPEKLAHLAHVSQEYHLSLHRLEGEERFHLALGESGRVMDVCRTGQRRAGLVRASG